MSVHYVTRSNSPQQLPSSGSDWGDEDLLQKLCAEMKRLEASQPKDSGDKKEGSDENPDTQEANLGQTADNHPMVSLRSTYHSEQLQPDLKLLHLLCKSQDMRQKAIWGLQITSDLFGLPHSTDGDPFRRLANVLINLWNDGIIECSEDMVQKTLTNWQTPMRLAHPTLELMRIVRDHVSAEPPELDQLVGNMRKRWKEYEAAAEACPPQDSGARTIPDVVDEGANNIASFPNQPVGNHCSEQFAPPAWFDPQSPTIAHIMPDLQLLHLLCLYGEFQLHTSNRGLRPSMLGNGAGLLTKPIQIVAAFLLSPDRSDLTRVGGDLRSSLTNQDVDEDTRKIVLEVANVIRLGVKIPTGDLDRLLATIIERDGNTQPQETSTSRITESASDGYSHTQRAKGNLREEEYAKFIWNIRTRPVTRCCALPYLLDGSPESIIDTLMVNALLWGRLDFAKAAKSKLYFTVTRNIAELARCIHKRATTVRESLGRLQGQHRIYVPIPPKRGRNSTTIHIGVKRGILFAPVLSPRMLWNLSVKRFLRAHEEFDAGTMKKELARLQRHYDRFPEDTAEQKEGKTECAAILKDFRDRIHQVLRVASTTSEQ